MFLVLHLDARAAASQVLETTRLHTDQVELLIFMQAGFGAGEVVDCFFRGLHDYKYIWLVVYSLIRITDDDHMRGAKYMGRWFLLSLMKSIVPYLISFTISAGSSYLMDFMKDDSQYPPYEALSAARLLKRSATGFDDTIFFM